jgi:protein subunit release factor A
MEKYKEYEGIVSELEDLRLMLEDESDSEMRTEIESELEELASREAEVAVGLQSSGEIGDGG